MSNFKNFNVVDNAIDNNIGATIYSHFDLALVEVKETITAVIDTTVTPNVVITPESYVYSVLDTNSNIIPELEFSSSLNLTVILGAL